MAGKRGQLGLDGCSPDLSAGVEAVVGGSEPARAARPRGVGVGGDGRWVNGADGPAARTVVRPAQVLVADGERGHAAVQELRQDRVAPRKRFEGVL